MISYAILYRIKKKIIGATKHMIHIKSGVYKSMGAIWKRFDNISDTTQLNHIWSKATRDPINVPLKNRIRPSGFIVE